MKTLKIVILGLIASGMAFAGSSSLADLARKEREISAKIKQEYLQGGETASSFNRLLQVHQKIRNASADTEVRTMIAYLDLCVGDMRRLLLTPNNFANVSAIADLDHSIREGTLYLEKLAKPKAIASR